MQNNEIPEVLPSDIVREIQIGFDKSILFLNEDKVAFKHVCDRSSRNAGTIICAPLLQMGNGHKIISHNPLTIVASILCSDCGTHGFVTDGIWKEC